MAKKSSYRPKFTPMLLEYFGQAIYKKVEKQVLTKAGVEVMETLEASDFPTLAGFAVKIGVHRSTMHEWTKRFPEWAEAYAKAKDFQENYLVVNGLKGLIPPVFAIFTAKNVLGWRDKQPGEEDKTIVNNITAKSDEELEARLKELLSE